METKLASLSRSLTNSATRGICFDSGMYILPGAEPKIRMDLVFHAIRRTHFGTRLLWAKSEKKTRNPLSVLSESEAWVVEFAQD